ncbi:hypothetical protein Y1Q_0018975 [Alligator mississippiensis]|uniref:Uncharacterized protein n=1 Tax=Alligator mississippiensis TaxID=8496 RepID=A0A151M3C9_ALLMI|nr:hypothetical protein Y1Q_0018975 [Alligator mississippiensis]
MERSVYSENAQPYKGSESQAIQTANPTLLPALNLSENVYLHSTECCPSESNPAGDELLLNPAEQPSKYRQP